jgi:hypothetical protein
MVTGLDGIHFITYRFDDTRRFMAQNGRRSGR